MLRLVPSAKEKMINVRLAPGVHESFKIACELRGASMSSLLHQFIVRTIREEKSNEPQAFVQPTGKYKLVKSTPTVMPDETKKRKTKTG